MALKSLRPSKSPFPVSLPHSALVLPPLTSDQPFTTVSSFRPVASPPLVVEEPDSRRYSTTVSQLDAKLTEADLLASVDMRGTRVYA